MSLGLIFATVRFKSLFQLMSILIVGVHANAGAAHVAAITPVSTAQIIFFLIRLCPRLSRRFLLVLPAPVLARCSPAR